ncbi:MAG: methyltransferase domain-containing protein [Myxococcales bacterium]|nr:methyltransferase domain-containing protein [Myxococcales bacterium]
MVARHELRRILDIGCGPGLFADELQRHRTLPRDGSYVGVDVSPAAIDLARTRLAGDARFTFRVGDAEHLDERGASDIDGIVVSFVLSYLDTHAVHRLAATLAQAYPRATLIVALTFRSCVDRLEDVAPDEERELRAARRYLRGHPAVAEGRWDVRRLLHYRASIETYYRLTEERTLYAQAQMLWVGRARSRRAAIRARPRTLHTIVRTPRRPRTS